MDGGVRRCARSIASGLGSDLVAGTLNGAIFGGRGELVMGELGLDGRVGPVRVDGGELVMGEVGLDGTMGPVEVDGGEMVAGEVGLDGTMGHVGVDEGEMIVEKVGLDGMGLVGVDGGDSSSSLVVDEAGLN